MPGSEPTRALASLLPWAKAQDIWVSEAQQHQLQIYLDNLLLWNRRVALVSRSEPPFIVEKHFADALIAAQHCRGASTVVDIGSGAGFPGIIVAIQSPGTRVTLIEARQRKASFLLDTIRTANLRNVEVVAERAESLARQPSCAGRYEISIARAFGSVEVLLEYSRTLLGRAGQAISMKGPAYEQEIDEATIESLGFQPPAVHPYLLPDLSKRVLLRFPRIPPC